jgi:acyl-CoA thioester hydrolase
MYYYKEIKIGVKFSVTVEIDGYSEDGKFFKLFQNFYNQKGEHLAHLDLAFGIMDTVKRKLTLMPEDSFNLFKELSRSKSFQILSKENMRIEGKSPLNI